MQNKVDEEKPLMAQMGEKMKPVEEKYERILSAIAENIHKAPVKLKG